MNKTCSWCGHEHQVMASASRLGEQRWFCHADDHSCYNDRRGRYFDDQNSVPAPAWDDSRLQAILAEFRAH